MQSQPQWVEKIYPSKVGRDHLGLGSVSFTQILPSLSPAINVLTHHPRYYSFYIFLLDEFWRRERPSSLKAWIKFYRPREFIFSVGAHLCQQPEHQDIGKIIGANVTQGLAAQQKDSYDTTTHYIDSRQGGYGLYYRTVMAELELIYLSRFVNKQVDLPSEKGRQLAAKFRQAVQHTDYYRYYFDDDTIDVPLTVIQEYIHQACLCQAQLPNSPDHALLLDAFLHDGQQDKAEARRETLRLFLDIAKQTNGTGLNQGLFRLLIYFGAAEDAVYHPHASVASTYTKWRLYQAREYYSFALNALWYHLCDWGIRQNGDIKPIQTAVFWEHLAASLDFTPLAQALNLPSPQLSADSGYTQLLDWLTSLMFTERAKFDTDCSLTSPIQEQKLYQLAQANRHTPAIMVTSMLTLLAIIYLRFGQAEQWRQPEWHISKMGANGRLSLHGFIQQLQHRLLQGPITLFEIAQWLYRDYIILQHQLIASSKLPENTFRFQREGNRLRFYQLKNRLEFMDSRYDALSTMVHELGLCGDLRQASHPLTPLGNLLLNKGDIA